MRLSVGSQKLKLEGAAILMDNTTFLTYFDKTSITSLANGKHENVAPLLWLDEFAAQTNEALFAPITLSFIQALSSRLLKGTEFRNSSELVALGFWLRRSNLQQKIASSAPIFESFHTVQSAQQYHDDYQPLGCVVHFTPANVDTMFVYSWVASLLMGNKNIVRVASQDSDSKIVLLRLLDELFQQAEFAEIARRNIFISYEKTSAMTAYLCQIADARMMWGGDASVEQIKAYPSKSQCRDFAFADKYSVAMLAASELCSEPLLAAQKLWRDTEAFQQQACSSPRVLFVIDENKTERTLIHAQLKILFGHINELAQQSSEPWDQISRVNEHLVALQNLAIAKECEAENALIQLRSISAVNLPKLTASSIERHAGNGFFYVRHCDSVQQVLKELANCLPEKLQTIAIQGLAADDVAKCASDSLYHQNYRIQPLGQALDFSFTWDGYQLLLELCQMRQMTVN